MITVRALDSPGLRCSYCHDALLLSASVGCPGCRTVLHDGCWSEAGPCPTLGCAPRRPRLVVTLDRAVSERRVFGIYEDSLVSGVLGSLLCVACALVLPAFARMFEETGIALPTSTYFVLWLPNWGWWALSVLSVRALVLKDRWLRRRHRSAVNGLYAAFVVAAGACVLYALVFAPHCGLMERL